MGGIRFVLHTPRGQRGVLTVRQCAPFHSHARHVEAELGHLGFDVGAPTPCVFPGKSGDCKWTFDASDGNPFAEQHVRAVLGRVHWDPTDATRTESDDDENNTAAVCMEIEQLLHAESDPAHKSTPRTQSCFYSLWARVKRRVTCSKRHDDKK